MARPKVNPDEKLEKPIPVKFSPFDKMRLKNAAKKERMPVSMFIRKLVLDGLNHKK
ncbi:MAG: hypothetical protein PHH69_02765 [Candidatus Omnitrophica bacterium]|nr:hypothetical protein [Candidatus Omnitrophota bacterium]